MIIHLVQKNHIRNSRIIYLKGNTKDIDKLLKKYKDKNSFDFSFW